jgi:hypothetical protein
VCFTQGGTTFNPITGIAVPNIINQLDFRIVNMSTDDSIKTSFATIANKIELKLKHKIHGFFNTMLKKLRQTPVAKTHTMANPIKLAVKSENNII